MATAIRVQEKRSVTYEQIGATTRIDGDRTVAEAVIANVAAFLLQNVPPHEIQSSAMLRNLTIKPLTNTEILAGFKLIQDIDIIVVVSNDTNRDPSDGGVMCTRGLTVHLDRNVTFLSASDRHALMAKHGSRRSLNMMGISKQAYEALGREVVRVMQQTGSRSPRRIAVVVPSHGPAPVPAAAAVPAPARGFTLEEQLTGFVAKIFICMVLSFACALFIMLLVGIGLLASCYKGDSEQCDARRRSGSWLVAIPCIMVCCGCVAILSSKKR